MINFLRLHFTHKPLQGSQKRIFLHIVYNHKAKAFSTLTHFPFNKNFTIITPRFPFTLTIFRFTHQKSLVTIIQRPWYYLHNTKNRFYATLTVNKPDPKPQDQQAFVNNPPLGPKNTRHLEIHKQTCIYPGCSGILCIGLCNQALQRKAIGHGTHGEAPITETDKKTVEVSTTDFNGQKKAQKIVFYKKPHDTTATPEHIQGTQQINNDPHIQQLIKTHES